MRRLRPGDLVTVRKQLGDEVSIWSEQPLADNAVVVGRLVSPHVALVVTTGVSDLGTDIVYVMCQDCHGWAMIAALERV